MAKGMLIVVGSGRSGTVYLTDILKKVYKFGFTSEPKFVYMWYRKYFKSLDYSNEVDVKRALRKVYNGRFFEKQRTRKKLNTSFDRLVQVATPSQINDYEDFIEGVFRYIAEIRGFDFPAYKDPLDVSFVGELAELMPNAKFLHIVRDGRDVASSLLNMPWGATNIYSGARFWAKGAYKGSQDGKRLGERYLEIKYEDFLLNPEKTANDIDQFQFSLTGQRKKDELLNFLKLNTRADANFRWKRTFTNKQVRLFNRAAGDELQYFGYNVNSEDLNDLSVISKFIYTIDDYVGRVINLTMRRNARKNKRSLNKR